MPLRGKKKDWPDLNEIVMATVTSTAKTGCYLTLDDYDSKSAFIHISEISTTWVRNVDDFIQTGQKVRVKVLGADQNSGRIDCSLKQVPLTFAEFKEEQV